MILELHKRINALTMPSSICLRLLLSLVVALSFCNIYDQTTVFSGLYNCGKKSQEPDVSKEDFGQPMGTLNGYDLYHVEEQPKTKIHCIGDTYQEASSWIYRSCEYQNLCFDLDRLDFVLFEEKFSSTSLPEGWHSSVLRDINPISGFEVNAKPRTTPQKGSKKNSSDGWFQPTVLQHDDIPQSYYLLNVTLMPFFRHQFAFDNPGHHLWQELFSLYTLIDMFQKEDTDILLVPLQQEIQDAYLQHGDMMNRWGSKLMGMPNYVKYNPFWQDGEMEIQIDGEKVPLKALSTRVVCAPTALTGVAQFSMHETHRHNGTHEREKNSDVSLYREIVPFYHGKGSIFRRFRHFLMQNLGVEDYPSGLSSRSVPTLFFSQNSSRRGGRKGHSFEKQMKYLQSKLPNDLVEIESGTLSKMSLEDQVRKMTETNIMFSIAGGGTASAIFLPPGSHLVIFYDKWLLDWDYWENISDLHVHWIPAHHLKKSMYLPKLKFLIEQCLGLSREFISDS